MVSRPEAAHEQDIDQLSINTIRFLAVDGVQKANSGHPGMPMGAAAMAYVLWTRFLRFNPRNPAWPNRDRFVLSAGHGSMLLYALLYLTGYDLPLEQLQQFRQWGSLTPGHPEHGLTPGVETTTGPLGQGFANAVGMAIAEAHLAARFNRPGHTIVNYHTYAIASDGDMMEGVASESASLAGHLKLGKLIVLYDDNHISIEGNTSLAFTEDVGTRFQGYDWQVLRVDGNNLGEVEAALAEARADTGRPSLIVARTHIGFGSPNRQDTAKAHGEPLGPDEVRRTKEHLDWPIEPAFLVPDAALARFREAVGRGQQWEAEWEQAFDSYRLAHEAEASELRSRLAGTLPDGWDRDIPVFAVGDDMATRAASGKVLTAIARRVPQLMGGSADLSPSTNTIVDGLGHFQPGSYEGRNMHFGVREHAMGSVMNGMALSRAIIPYGATFLIFSEYMRPPIRLASLMEQHTIYVYTHDSIGLGEDGPTHQPVEQLASLRSIPGLTVIRPADSNETAEAWRVATAHAHGPVALVLTRQKVPTLDRSVYGAASGLARGGYVLKEASSGAPAAILIATGSEVSIAVAAAAELESGGVATRVVSMPSWELFEAQTSEYRDGVLPPAVTARVAVEAGVSQGWDRYVGRQGSVVCMTRFGASAPYETLMKEFGFTPEAIAARVRACLAGS
ncbi:MAG TPA: transketolase [Blastocatellia bacterium]|nr:transketolase [Blastocatellia bacterium]